MIFDCVLRSDTERARLDWRTATEADLRYDCFFGDIILIAGSVNLSARWGWVTILDFAISLNRVCRDLEIEGLGFCDSTESDARIQLSASDENVVVSTSYVDGDVSMPMSEFLISARSFVARVFIDVEARHPDLRYNVNFRRAIDLPASPG